MPIHTSHLGTLAIMAIGVAWVISMPGLDAAQVEQVQTTSAAITALLSALGITVADIIKRFKIRPT